MTDETIKGKFYKALCVLVMLDDGFHVYGIRWLGPDDFVIAPDWACDWIGDD